MLARRLFGRRSWPVQSCSSSTAWRHALWSRSLSDRARAAQARAWLLASAFATTDALAQGGTPPDVERRGFSFDLRLALGAASAEFTERDRPVADFEALALGGGARFGWFLDEHVLLGAELTGSWHAALGAPRVQDPSYFSSGGAPSGATYSVIV